MKMVCCGVVYSTNDPETFWCIEIYGVNPVSKEIADGKRVEKEVVYSLRCKKNGCAKIEIHRFDQQGVLIGVQKLNGYKATRFLAQTAAFRYRIRPKYPFVQKYSKNIPLVYGKAVNSYTQKFRYVTEEGDSAVEKVFLPVRAYRL